MTTQNYRRKLGKVRHRDGNRCQLCGKTKNQSTMNLDHIIPKSKGGSNFIENLVLSHDTCNRRKGDNVVECTFINRQRIFQAWLVSHTGMAFYELMQNGKETIMGTM